MWGRVSRPALNVLSSVLRCLRVSTGTVYTFARRVHPLTQSKTLTGRVYRRESLAETDGRVISQYELAIVISCHRPRHIQVLEHFSLGTEAARQPGAQISSRFKISHRNRT